MRAGLIPIMFSRGMGSDVMKRIVAPMVGGVISSTILEIISYPAIYMIWRSRSLEKNYAHGKLFKSVLSAQLRIVFILIKFRNSASPSGQWPCPESKFI